MVPAITRRPSGPSCAVRPHFTRSALGVSAWASLVRCVLRRPDPQLPLTADSPAQPGHDVRSLLLPMVARPAQFLSFKPVGLEEPCPMDYRTHHDLVAIDSVVDDIVAVDQLASRGVMRTDRAQARRVAQEIDLGEDGACEPISSLWRVLRDVFDDVSQVRERGLMPTDLLWPARSHGFRRRSSMSWRMQACASF